jgi:UPF0755 protein
VKVIDGIQRFLSQTAYVWLAGVLFLLFIAGYVLYFSVWVLRFCQTRKKLLYSVGAALVIAGGALYYLLFPLYGRHDHVTMVIPHGYTVNAIADTLYKQGIISSRKVLVAWLRVSGIERRIQAGKFSFVTRFGVVAAAGALNRPVPLDRFVTIPEGLTIEQVAEHMGRTFAIDTAEFVRLCSTASFLKELGLDPAQSAEGYLFPDTYSFNETARPAEMVRRMVGRFNEEWKTIDAAAAGGRTLTKREVVIVASIVEKEAVLGTELPRIAGVFINRLRLGMPLGADPTVRYIFKKWNGPLYLSELKNTSPYNTRVHKGLPPGPICSPGRAALAAVVSPAKTNELYFVAKWDGSGGHEFSATYTDHVRKKNSIQRNNERRIGDKEASCTN